MNRIKSRRRRAVVLLEFVLTLPMFLFLVLFVIDVGRVMMVSNAMQDSTYRAARAGAVYGAAEAGGFSPSRDAFDQAISELPGASAANIENFRVVRGRTCTVTDPYVEIDVEYSIEMITPGLGALLQMASSKPSDDPFSGEYEVTSNAIARCEVAR